MQIKSMNWGRSESGLAPRGTGLGDLCRLVWLAAFLWHFAAAAEPGLERGFANPPDTAKPWTLWFRQSGHLTKEALTRDLEEMKAKGIGGAQFWDSLIVGAHMAPVPLKIHWLSDEWWDLYRHMIREADRLDLGLSAQLCWNINCSGPWIAPSNTIQHVVFTEVQARGPADFSGVLPHPEVARGYYRDIAVLALKQEGTNPVAAVKDWPFKSARVPYQGSPAVWDADVSGESRLLRDTVVDLTGRMDANGRLNWQTPPGNWTLLRVGHTPAPAAEINETKPLGNFLEVDFYNAEAMDIHFAELGRRLIANAGKAAGRTLRYLHTDSWEYGGGANWTRALPAEFKRRRGYDLTPYLPVLAGKIVESRDISNRFLWDFRRTLADLIAENHYGRLRTLAEAHGLATDCEAGGPFCYHIDALQNLGQSEVPMGEFWLNGTQFEFVKQAASAAHIYGRKLVGAEAFTSIGPHWEEDPAMMKPLADRAFCLGANRLYIHEWAHSPAEWGKPGFEYFAGSHHNQNVTWWEQSGPWLAYLARCQFLLQRGRFVADVCYFVGEDVPALVSARENLKPALPDGYDCDSINADALFRRVRVRNGRIVLPDGLGYRVLVLPQSDRMTPRVLKRIKELVEAGAVVIGSKPAASPSLDGHPQCDAEVRQLADELWDRGGVIAGKTLKTVLLDHGVAPDFESNGPVNYIHRRDGHTEIYFVASSQKTPMKVDCTFRVSGRQPEIWDPMTGRHRKAGPWESSQGRTTVPLEFAPNGSWFVVFRQSTRSDQGVAKRNFPAWTAVQTVEGPWAVQFDPQWGGPQVATFEKLVSWPERSEAGIKYYSGKATYRKTFDLPPAIQPGKTPAIQLAMDLGEVMNVAVVRLNGKNLGVLWTRPFRVDITDAVRAGTNQLEVDVVNLWPNRLIGDGKLPPDKRRTKTNVTKFDGGEHALLASGLLGPVQIISRSEASQE